MAVGYASRGGAVLIAVALLAAAPGPQPEAQVEAAFLRVPSAVGVQLSSRVINRRYHYAGTPGDYRLALYMRDTMWGFGLHAWLESFTATVYTPRLLQLEILTSPAYAFDLRDGKIPADPDGSRPGVPLPFNAGSGNGDVRAPLVDAGRGLDADYDRLAKDGTQVRGSIALIRYGAEYRGNLAARAAARGAAGVIFYNSPQDEAPGLAYPNGPNRPPGAVQRGDVMGNDNVPLRIPTLPVTLSTAQRLLANLHAARAPVRLHVEMTARRTTLWNTIGEVAGRDPSQTVVLGGHRDAWVYGVTDDGSGISTLLEVARGLGALARSGWRPERSILIAGWDGEEIGELGSAAYVRAHRAQLERGCIAYVNVDEAAAGPNFRAEVAAALVPAYAPAVRDVLDVDNPPADDPSGGSDYESFIYTLGTPIVNLGYGGAFGTYHSTYDDYRYAARFADPGFLHHRAIAQTVGLLAIRLAESGAAAYRFAPYAKALDAGLTELAASAARAHLTLPPALPAAVSRFEAAARGYDARGGARDEATALQAAQRLDLLAYSANGYASVAFPQVAVAIAAGNQGGVDAAAGQTGAALDRVTALLAPR